MTNPKKTTKKPAQRCWWCGEDPIYVDYHDTEWGVPVHDDRHLFESLCLDGQQAGLNWLMVLKKRDHYRKKFKNFDILAVSRMTDNTIEKLLLDKGLIRNRLKLYSIRSNALATLKVQEKFGSLNNYLWQFVNGRPIDGACKLPKDIPASNALSDTVSKDLKKRGFKFVGSTIVYAFLQACGFINDHLSDCPRYEDIQRSNRS